MKALRTTLAAAVAGIGLVGCSAPAPRAASPTPTTAPASTTSTTAPAAPVETPEAVIATPAATDVLDHSGYSTIRMGMTKDQLVATGLVRGPLADPVASCQTYGLHTGKATVVVDVPTARVVSINVGSTLFTAPEPNDVRTPEGVRPLDTLAAARAAYPSLVVGGAHSTVDLGNGYLYRFLGDPVSSITLAEPGSPCAG
ncbi:hypothetical protein SUDANB95_04575 [Actinosynnema sp. ALI-1.44]